MLLNYVIGKWFTREKVHYGRCASGVSEQKKFLFFGATFEQLSLQKANFDGFLATFAQIFREITGNVLENLEQLAESPTGGAI